MESPSRNIPAAAGRCQPKHLGQVEQLGEQPFCPCPRQINRFDPIITLLSDEGYASNRSPDLG
jgi:hypothetical protein